MLKRIAVFIVRHLPIAAAGLAAQLTVVSSVAAEINLEQALLHCREEMSALLRLDCYDKILKPAVSPATANIVRGEIAKKALAQEARRPEHSTDFVVSQAEGSISPEVIVTTPALGAMPPRPVLVFSCLDNITRMQIVLFEPLPPSSRSLLLKTNTGVELESHWFIRDNGYLLESSRGLPGISQIQKLFNAETLNIESENTALNGLSFNITHLSQEIAPLRQACRW